MRIHVVMFECCAQSVSERAHARTSVFLLYIFTLSFEEEPRRLHIFDTFVYLFPCSLVIPEHILVLSEIPGERERNWCLLVLVQDGKPVKRD
jgi:hypothetical protein